MKPTPPTIPNLYTKWLQPGWAMLAGLLPGQPAKEATPKPSQVAAEQEWEDEGGSIKPPKKPPAEQGPKLPL